MVTIRHFLSISTFICLLSCNGKTGSSEEQAADTTADGIPAGVEISDCYVYKTERDSAYMRIDILDNDMAVGELSYAIAEKDRNQGTFTGSWYAENSFVAHYTFQSEGVESVREVAFRQSGSGWVEGFGEMKDSAGVMIFKDRKKIDFEKGLHFEQVKCPPAK